MVTFAFTWTKMYHCKSMMLCSCSAKSKKSFLVSFFSLIFYKSNQKSNAIFITLQYIQGILHKRASLPQKTLWDSSLLRFSQESYISHTEISLRENQISDWKLLKITLIWPVKMPTHLMQFDKNMYGLKKNDWPAGYYSHYDNDMALKNAHIMPAISFN